MVQPDLTEQLIELIPRMRRFATGLSGSTAWGDDLVQAACERLLQRKDALQPDSRLDSWLYQVIRNLHIDGIRAQSVRDRNADEIKLVADLRPVSTDPMQAHIRLGEVNDAMQLLSEEHRSALMLICVEGLSYKEAAEVLQVPMGTVTSRLVRARKSLIEKLGGESFELELGVSR
ncbi:MAG: sigma-70 family RNA polymerase sigma factor [Gammaproteobacteria bacterium]|nr:sigma-70 family RNA polymerase sigma factor [Gammaproteobacteria bacterium]